MTLIECRQCGLIKDYPTPPHKCPQCHAEGTLFPCGAWKQEQQNKFPENEEIIPNDPHKLRICASCGRPTPQEEGSFIAPPTEDAVVGLRFYCNSCRPKDSS